MARTSGDLTAGKALAAKQGGNGHRGRYGLKAKLAAGVATLGCVAALVFGVGHAEQTAPAPSAAPAPTQLSVGTDDLATTGCIGTAGPFACQAGPSLAGTDDLATNVCVGATGPFACATLPTTASGTDDFALGWCSETAGPFACATALPTATAGTDDLATGCVGTTGPFACATATARTLPDLWDLTIRA